MNEETIKDLAMQAGFTVTRNMQGPVDVIEGRAVEARSEWVQNMTLARFVQYRSRFTHFTFYTMAAGVDYTFVRSAMFTPCQTETQ